MLAQFTLKSGATAEKVEVNFNAKNTKDIVLDEIEEDLPVLELVG